MVTKQLYPAVAKRPQTNWKQIERNMRTIISATWEKSVHF